MSTFDYIVKNTQASVAGSSCTAGGSATKHTCTNLSWATEGAVGTKARLTNQALPQPPLTPSQ